jgi:hypothetical protein
MAARAERSEWHSILGVRHCACLTRVSHWHLPPWEARLTESCVVLTNIIGECRTKPTRPDGLPFSVTVNAMHASLVRRNLSGLVPPKIASPSILVSTAALLH